jgi:hypothetical protein
MRRGSQSPSGGDQRSYLRQEQQPWRGERQCVGDNGVDVERYRGSLRRAETNILGETGSHSGQCGERSRGMMRECEAQQHWSHLQPREFHSESL